MIEKVSYAPYLELFARHPALGWEAWGMEADGGGNQLQLSETINPEQRLLDALADARDGEPSTEQQLELYYELCAITDSDHLDLEPRKGDDHSGFCEAMRERLLEHTSDRRARNNA